MTPRRRANIQRLGGEEEPAKGAEKNQPGKLCPFHTSKHRYLSKRGLWRAPLLKMKSWRGVSHVSLAEAHNDNSKQWGLGLTPSLGGGWIGIGNSGVTKEHDGNGGDRLGLVYGRDEIGGTCHQL